MNRFGTFYAHSRSDVPGFNWLFVVRYWQPAGFFRRRQIQSHVHIVCYVHMLPNQSRSLLCTYAPKPKEKFVMYICSRTKVEVCYVHMLPNQSRSLLCTYAPKPK